MKRRDFVQLAGLGIGGALLPFAVTGHSIPVAALLDSTLDVHQKKALADIALNTARSGGAAVASGGGRMPSLPAVMPWSDLRCGARVRRRTRPPGRSDCAPAVRAGS